MANGLNSSSPEIDEKSMTFFFLLTTKLINKKIKAVSSFIFIHHKNHPPSRCATVHPLWHNRIPACPASHSPNYAADTSTAKAHSANSCLADSSTVPRVNLSRNASRDKIWRINWWNCSCPSVAARSVFPEKLQPLYATKTRYCVPVRPGPLGSRNGAGTARYCHRKMICPGHFSPLPVWLLTLFCPFRGPRTWNWCTFDRAVHFRPAEGMNRYCGLPYLWKKKIENKQLMKRLEQLQDEGKRWSGSLSVKTDRMWIGPSRQLVMISSAPWYGRGTVNSVTHFLTCPFTAFLYLFPFFESKLENTLGIDLTNLEINELILLIGFFFWWENGNGWDADRGGVWAVFEEPWRVRGTWIWVLDWLIGLIVAWIFQSLRNFGFFVGFPLIFILFVLLFQQYYRGIFLGIMGGAVRTDERDYRRAVQGLETLPRQISPSRGGENSRALWKI